MRPYFTMRAGFIGYRNFAEKLKVLFEQSGHVKDFIFFHPKKDIPGLLSTRRLRHLFDSDFIVIASPDWTHETYLRELKSYKGYIFCEKIPTINRSGLIFLKKHLNPKLYFNFNLRKSYLCDIIKKHSTRLIYINCFLGQGFALKKAYKDNWRSKNYYAPLGVFELSGIHLFDLLIFCLGRPKSYYFVARNISHYGNSIDNFNITLEFKYKIIANLFFSYTSPFYFNFEIVTKDILIKANEHGLTIRGPRETYYKRTGLFKLPPIISSRKCDLYKDSLRDSVGYFLKIVRDEGKFEDTASENNLLSTEVFLDILDSIKAKGYLKLK